MSLFALYSIKDNISVMLEWEKKPRVPEFQHRNAAVLSVAGPADTACGVGAALQQVSTASFRQKNSKKSCFFRNLPHALNSSLLFQPISTFSHSNFPTGLQLSTTFYCSPSFFEFLSSCRVSTSHTSMLAHTLPSRSAFQRAQRNTPQTKCFISKGFCEEQLPPLTWLVAMAGLDGQRRWMNGGSPFPLEELYFCIFTCWKNWL